MRYAVQAGQRPQAGRQVGHGKALAQRQRFAPALQQASDGQSVHYGVRPGDITVSASGAGIPAKVVVVEPTGAETELVLDVGGATVVVVMHGRTTANPNDTVYLDILGPSAHVFDAGSGARLE